MVSLYRSPARICEAIRWSSSVKQRSLKAAVITKLAMWKIVVQDFHPPPHQTGGESRVHFRFCRFRVFDDPHISGLQNEGYATF